MINVRSHPGPLPQERGNSSPPTCVANPSNYVALTETHIGKAATPIVTSRLSSDIRLFSLSPRESDGVRASDDSTISAQLRSRI